MKIINSLYEHTKDVHNTRAGEIVVPILFQYVRPKSVLDIGCGIGTWLKVFKEHGISDILGVDGEYVNRSMLEIDEANFLSHDLCKPLDIQKNYDLIISLEVAEHLPERAADVFIETLVRHGKIILFSAAIPGQGGQNHLNEQWPAYWQEKFAKHGYYYYDIIRPRIWGNSEVDIWYRQNMFILFHESVKPNFTYYSNENLIHPEYWRITQDRLNELNQHVGEWREGKVGIQNSSKSFYRAVLNKLQSIGK